MSTSEEQWQEKCKGIEDSMEHLKKSEVYCDVKFVLFTGQTYIDGSEQIEFVNGHKLIIFARSSKFAGLFSKPIGQMEEIKITNVLAADFKVILQFMYYNDVSAINRENIVNIYSAAKIYGLVPLKNECLDLLLTSINEQNVSALADDEEIKVFDHDEENLLDEHNVFELKNAAKKFGDSKLVYICWFFIENNLHKYYSKKLLREEFKQDLMKHEPVYIDSDSWEYYIDDLTDFPIASDSYELNEVLFFCSLLQKWSKNAGLPGLEKSFERLQKKFQVLKREKDTTLEINNRPLSQASIICMEDDDQNNDEKKENANINA